MSRPIRVLIIDDSALVREILSKGLSADPGIEVVGTAPDPYIARDKIVQLKPDVLTLDVEMPRMDGVEFLRRLMPQYPLPVVMVSSMTEKGRQVTLDALDAGAVDFVTKPSANMSSGLSSMMTELCTKIKIASSANVSHWKQKKVLMSPAVRPDMLMETTHKVIAIGASTGGIEAIRQVITQFPPSTPGVAIVQHMPPGFTRLFADRMNNLCMMEVKEAQDGDRITPGRILIAPGDKHLKVIRSGSMYYAECKPGQLVCGHCPSVEVLMQSVARSAGQNAIGVMLTGMGSDGADGMKAIRDAGGHTFAQDESSCVVFGMPKAAYLRGGVEHLVPVGNIAHSVLNLLVKKS